METPKDWKKEVFEKYPSLHKAITGEKMNIFGCKNAQNDLAKLFKEFENTQIQPTEIEQLMKEKLADRKIDDELGWTGEWRMSAKNVLDLIIDLQNNNTKTLQNHIIDGCASLMMLVTGHELNIYQRGDARQELDKLLSDKKNALQQIEKLEADKEELIEKLEEIYGYLGSHFDGEKISIGELIQKHKQ